MPVEIDNNVLQVRGPLTYPPEYTTAQKATPGFFKGVSALASNPNVIIPNTDFSSLSASLTSITQVCGKLSNIINATSTSIILVNAAKRNVPGFCLTVAGAAVSGALNDAGFDANNVVRSAVNHATELVKSPLVFLEKAFRAQAYSQASFTGNAWAKAFEALNAVGNLLNSAKTLTDLLSGGVTANLGPAAGNTANGQRLTARGISITGDQIRAGIAACTAAMRNMGTLWDPANLELFGTERGLVLSLKQQGIADACGLRQPLLEVGCFLDDDDSITSRSDYSLKEALTTITGANLRLIVERCMVRVANPAMLRTAADFTQPDVVVSQAALDNIPYGTLNGFAQSIANIGIRRKVTLLEIADALDQLDLPDVGLIDNASFASDVANLGPNLGRGSGLFGDATITDLIGTAAGAAHNDAYRLLQEAQANLLNTPEGIELKTALDYYDLHHDVNLADNAQTDPLYTDAVNKLVAALDAIGNSTSPDVQAAVAQADKSMLDSALQLVNEAQQALAIGMGIYTTVTALIAAATKFGAWLSSTPQPEPAKTSADQSFLAQLTSKLPEGYWAWTQGLNAAINACTRLIQAAADITGLTGIVEACLNPYTPGGQAIKAMLAEARNSAALSTLGVKMPGVSANEELKKKQAELGVGLTLEQLRIIDGYVDTRGLGYGDRQKILFVNGYFGYQRAFFESEGIFEQDRAWMVGL